jgi:excisionase family DNA binding protein
MKTIFTTSEVAKLCKVAPRTVSKWFDSGRLRGYRIPGSQDRRIPREHLIRFLTEHGMTNILTELESQANPEDESARLADKVFQYASAVNCFIDEGYDPLLFTDNEGVCADLINAHEHLNDAIRKIEAAHNELRSSND